MKNKASTFYQAGFYFLLVLSGMLTVLLIQSERANLPELRETENQPDTAHSIPEQLRAEDATLADFPEPANATSQISVDQKLEALAQLTEDHGIRVNFEALIGQKNQIRGAFIELFDLSSSQADALDQLLDRTQASLLGERAKHAAATIEKDGSVSIELGPFIETGRDLMDSFYGELERILGTSKLDALERIAGDPMNNHFKQFGAEIARYTLEAKFNNDGTKYYHYTRHVELEHGHTSHSSSFSSFETGDASIAELSALLSPDVKRHLESLAQ